MRAIKRVAFRYFIPPEEDVSGRNETPMRIVPTRSVKDKFVHSYIGLCLPTRENENEM